MNFPNPFPFPITFTAKSAPALHTSPLQGSPSAPRCGFSRRVAAMLEATGKPFGNFDILEDEAVRQGLKEFSNWPTFPQLYVDGELVGGCDVLEQLAEMGQLADALEG